jgi:hypothetical protein
MIGWGRNWVDRSRWRSALLLFSLIAAGCGGESAQQAIARRQKELNLPPREVVKFSGTVTIDGQRPEVLDGHVLLVALCAPNDPPPDKKPPRYAIVHKDGTFQFGEDGVVPASYVVAIALLRRGKPGSFRGPDALHNLYNDPEKNASLEGFALDLKPPGKTNANFNLTVAGQEPVATPGPKALIKFFGTPQ